MEDAKLLQRITVNPKIMVGKPVIRGTRIPVDTIIRQVAEGMKVDEILEDYPQLTKEDITAALMYGADIVSGESVMPVTVKEHAKVSG
ncbi:DUF433 domain-containing protein [Candidatus Woesearchaeota archaeon]|nr:DUF433 domain-containing protein [Candidatus Woesearchaeota archaeon]